MLRRSNQARQRITLIVIGLALLVVAGILIAGYVIAFVMPPRQDGGARQRHFLFPR